MMQWICPSAAREFGFHEMAEFHFIHAKTGGSILLTAQHHFVVSYTSSAIHPRSALLLLPIFLFVAEDGIVHPQLRESATMKLSIAVPALLYNLLHLVSAEATLAPFRTSKLELAPDFKPPPVFKNTNLVRNTNLEKGYVRETVNVIVENVDKEPQDSYFLSFPTDVYGKIGALDVRDRKAPNQKRLNVIPTDLEASR